MSDLQLPGASLVEKGIQDLEHGLETIEALLVSQAPTALREVGWPTPRPIENPESKLYELLSRLHGNGAHSKYNAFRHQLASFLRAARCARSAREAAADQDRSPS